MKRIALALVVALTVSGCATNPKPTTTPILSPTAQTLLMTSLSALQTASIALAAVDGIPAADTTTVVNVIATALAVVQASSTGWVSTVDVILAKLPGDLSPSTAATLGPYLNAISVVIADLYGTGVTFANPHGFPVGFCEAEATE